MKSYPIIVFSERWAFWTFWQGYQANGQSMDRNSEQKYPESFFKSTLQNLPFGCIALSYFFLVLTTLTQNK
jgi:hypothetical protein